MNKKALEYEVYKAILETDLTSEQKQRLIEVGIFQKIAGWLGAGKDALTKDMSKFFADRKYGQFAAKAMQNIEKELESIKAAAKDATGNEGVVYDILKAILEKQGMSPQQVASGSGSEKAAEGGASGGGKPVSSGQPVTMSAAGSNDQLLLQVLKAVLELKGVTGDKADEDAKEALDKATPEKALGEMVGAISGMTGVAQDKVQKVYKWLEDNKHIKVDEVKAENFRRNLKPILKRKSSRLPLMNENMTQRWQKLAGILIMEGPATDELLEKIKKKEIKNNLDLEKAIKAAKPEEIKDFEESKESLSAAVKGDPAFGNLDLDKMLAAAKQAGDKGEEQVKNPQEAEAAAKQFKSLIDDARKQIKPEDVSDSELGAILGALDKLAAFSIS